MKIILYIILFFSFGTFKRASIPKNFYFSTAIGDDSRTPTQAQNASTPWKTLTKANQLLSNSVSGVTLTAGDNVLFNRGETFDGNLNITVSGTSTAPITIGAYGSGERPTINCLKTLPNSWTANGNLYTNNQDISAAPFSISYKPKYFIKNGVLVEVGRFPNKTDANTDSGFLKVTSTTSSTAWTNSTFTNFSNKNWVGATAVMRTTAFTSGTGTITNQTTSGTATTFTYLQDVNNNAGIIKNYGFFIINDLQTLDRNNEYYFDEATNKVTFYFTSAPTSDIIQVPAYDNGIMSSTEYIQVNEINVIGANSTGIYFTSGNGYAAKSCSVNYVGNHSIYFSSVVNGTISDCNVKNSLGMGIRYGTGSGAMITRDTVDYICMSMAMKPNGGAQGAGIFFDRSPGTVSWCRVTNTGFSSIHKAYSSNTLIEYNYMSKGLYILNDVGMLYDVNGGSTYTMRTNNIMRYNIIEDIFTTSWHGSDKNSVFWMAYGLYLDNFTAGVEVYGNTVLNTNTAFYAHHVINVSFYNNLMYGNTRGIYLNNDRPDSVKNLVIHDNTIVSSSNASSSSSQFVYIVNNQSAHPLQEMGNFYNNKYFRPLAPNDVTFYTSDYRNGAFSSATWSFATWKSTYNWDLNGSSTPPLTYASISNPETVFKPIYNAANSAQTYVLDGKVWKDTQGATFDNSVTLQPFASKLLMYYGLSSGAVVPANPNTIPVDKTPPIPLKTKFIRVIK